MVTGNRSGELVATVNVREHKVISGLSAQNGGHDEGPNPHEYIEAALSACTILTIELYAKRKQMKIENIECSVKITSETKDGAVISRDLRFVGELSDEDRTRLLEIANKCPIHRLLQGSVTIETQLLA